MVEHSTGEMVIGPRRSNGELGWYTIKKDVTGEMRFVGLVVARELPEDIRLAIEESAGDEAIERGVLDRLAGFVSKLDGRLWQMVMAERSAGGTNQTDESGTLPAESVI
ncbi:MAG: hypothetical protein HWD60_03010 [Defluviicoccus sp.]|nr:MAG: hypothetical protein HWD60_03010 [Defluviicoccus sp.]